jgi:hypothetical protein
MMLLQHREALKLTAEQVQQLEALQAAHKADCERRMALVKAADEAAVAALERPDLAAYEAKLREAAGTGSSARWTWRGSARRGWRC